MASTSVEQVLQVPARSISLPARLLHPNVMKIEGELNKLKIWKSSYSSSAAAALTAIPSSAEFIQSGLIRLADFYNCIEEFIHSPCTQQVLRNQQQKKIVEEGLYTSIGLLDACNNAGDLILLMKEQMQDLQSALRRRGGDSSTESSIQAYISFRKKSKKDIAKCLGALKRAEGNMGSFYHMVDVDQQTLMVINVLRESSAITFSVFRSILFFLSMPELKDKAAGGWSLIRKLMPVASKKGQEILNEVGNVDMVLCSLHGQIRNNDANFDVQMAIKRLETLDLCINGLESGLDCLFRRLIQYRVSLLNILTLEGP